MVEKNMTNKILKGSTTMDTHRPKITPKHKKMMGPLTLKKSTPTITSKKHQISRPIL